MLPLILHCSLAGASPGDVPTALDGGAYRFCHEAGASAEDARAWCDLLEGLDPERCPGLVATCAGAEEPPVASGCAPASSGPREQPVPGPEPREPSGCTAPDWDADATLSVLRWVGALGVAALLLVVLRLLMRWYGVRRAAPERSVVVVDEVALEEPPAEAPVEEGEGSDLLGRARAALAEGRTGEAVLLARSAALRGLAEQGVVRLHRSRTDREYVRGVTDSPLREALRQVLGAVEAHRWGGRLLTEARARAAIEGAARILAAVLLVVVGADAHAQSDRHGPLGDTALLSVLRAHGYEASWRLRGLDELGDEADALVVDLHHVDVDADTWLVLDAWVFDGGVLVLAGDAEVGFPDLGVAALLYGGAASLGPGVAGLDLSTPRWPGGPRRGWVGGSGEPWVVADSGPDSAAVVEVLEHGEGRVVAISDERLLWNGAFVDPANEWFVADLLYVGQERAGFPLPTPARVQLATTAAGGADSPLDSLQSARLLPFVAQLLLFWTVLALWRGWPMGPLHDPPGEGRHHFAEHVVALGSRYARLGASAHAASAYARLWLARLGPAGIELAAVRAGRSPDDARELVARVQRATEPGTDARSDLELMEDLWTVTRRG